MTGTTTNEATALQKLIGSMDLIKPMLTTALTNKKKARLCIEQHGKCSRHHPLTVVQCNSSVVVYYIEYTSPDLPLDAII